MSKHYMESENNLSSPLQNSLKQQALKTYYKKNDTVKKNCYISDKCQSCKYINVLYQQGLQEKFSLGCSHLNNELSDLKIQFLPVVPSPKKLNYRCIAKLAVRVVKKKHSQKNIWGFGLFEPNSHKIIDIKTCQLHHSSIQKILFPLQKKLEESSLSAWNEQTRTGDISYLLIRSSHLIGELLVTVVVSNLKVKKSLRDIFVQLRNEGHKIRSVFLSLKEDSGNNILGKKMIPLLGKNSLREFLCELQYEISPTSFFQVNPWLASLLYRRIEQLVGNVSNKSFVAWDLYCGVGVISLLLARLGFQVWGIEENPNAIQNANQNSLINNLSENLDFSCLDVEKALFNVPSWASSPKFIVVNPSRKGLGETIIKQLSLYLLGSHKKTALIYVSCNIITLSKDLKFFQELDLNVRQIEAFDMFAYTDKLEWLSVITSK